VASQALTQFIRPRAARGSWTHLKNVQQDFEAKMVLDISRRKCAKKHAAKHKKKYAPFCYKASAGRSVDDMCVPSSGVGAV